jgi:type IV secretory pathway ATPase VirB11/archaellum biosynthesis ATPase
MTAPSGGGRPGDGTRSPMSPVLERPEAAQGGARPEPRPLGEIFPQSGSAHRGRELQGTWRAFCQDMAGAVETALDRGRSPPEIAYALGELVHNYFRTRGVTLTSYELRRLVAELLSQQGSAKPAEALVSFAGEPVKAPWAGDEPSPEATPRVPEAAFEAPPSPLVSVRPPDAAALDRLLARVLERVPGRLTSWQRESVVQAIGESIDEALGVRTETLPPQTREQLAAVALSELVGLGLIDRLWTDRTVRAIFVNGPKVVFVERNGLVEAAGEVFRDEAHLLALLGRLVARPASGVAEFTLRDGGVGAVIFPPAAPTGPVLTLRRGEPGMATLERLVRSGMLAPAIADLLRIAARSSLNMLVSGPEGSGKTALLAAIARDLDGVARVVTVARHRQFRWAAPSKVELVVSQASPYPVVLAAAARLQPSLLVLDSIRFEDAPALGERLLRGERGTLAALGPAAMAAGLARSVDLVVRLGRGRDGLSHAVSLEDANGQPVFVHDDGGFHRRTVAPAFAPIVQAKGYGEALARLLR